MLWKIMWGSIWRVLIMKCKVNSADCKMASGDWDGVKYSFRKEVVGVFHLAVVLHYPTRAFNNLQIWILGWISHWQLSVQPTIPNFHHCQRLGHESHSRTRRWKESCMKRTPVGWKYKDHHLLYSQSFSNVQIHRATHNLYVSHDAKIDDEDHRAELGSYDRQKGWYLSTMQRRRYSIKERKPLRGRYCAVVISFDE